MSFESDNTAKHRSTPSSEVIRAIGYGAGMQAQIPKEIFDYRHWRKSEEEEILRGRDLLPSDDLGAEGIYPTYS